MKIRIFTYVECPCGHRGALVESSEAAVLPDGWHQTWLRKLTHAGPYDGGNDLFAEMTPGCPACGRSLGPDDVIGHSEQRGTAKVLRLKGEPRSSGTLLSLGS